MFLGVIGFFFIVFSIDFRERLLFCWMIIVYIFFLSVWEFLERKVVWLIFEFFRVWDIIIEVWLI